MSEYEFGKCVAGVELVGQAGQDMHPTHCLKPGEVFVVAKQGLAVGMPKAFCGECYPKACWALERFSALHPNDPSVNVWAEVPYEEYLVAWVMWN